MASRSLRKRSRPSTRTDSKYVAVHTRARSCDGSAVATAKTSGVKCVHCGASTPLPADLRVPTFECAYCHGQLETAKYAGEGAVRVDEMGAYLNTALQTGSTEGMTAPKLVHGTAGFRELPCLACKVTLQVPLDVTINQVTCGGCGKTAPVNRYIDDVERMNIDMARQQAGNDEVKRLIAEGVSCRKCNAPNPVLEPISVQQTCTSCGGVILLSDYAPADAIDRQRLKAVVFGIRDQAMAMNAAHGRRNAIIIACVIGVVIAIVLGINFAR